MYNASMKLRQAIIEVQEIGERHGFIIAIVGGAFVRLISKEVKIQKMESKDKVIYLSSAPNPGVRREEDPSTTVDIDAIAFSTNTNPFLPEIKQKFAQMQAELQKLQQSDKSFPSISIEPVFYHPAWDIPNTLFQFVSSVEKYSEQPHHFVFRLGSIEQKIKEESLDTWKYVFVETNESILSLLPQAIQIRYAIRGFAKKPKDVEKIWGEKSAFAVFVKQFQQRTTNSYDYLFKEWHEFEKSIQKATDPSTKIKRGLWNLYWNSIGTYLAHGTGLIGKILLPLGNTFFAGK